MGKSKSKTSSSDGIPLMGFLKPAAGVAVALAGYYFLQGIQTEVRPLCKMQHRRDSSLCSYHCIMGTKIHRKFLHNRAHPNSILLFMSATHHHRHFFTFATQQLQLHGYLNIQRTHVHRSRASMLLTSLRSEKLSSGKDRVRITSCFARRSRPMRRSSRRSRPFSSMRSTNMGPPAAMPSLF